MSTSGGYDPGTQQQDPPYRSDRAGGGPGFTPPSAWRRSSTDRFLGGVCGGLARNFNLDPVIVRVGVAALTLFSGIGIFAYLAAWVLLPDEHSDTPPLQRAMGRHGGWGHSEAQRHDPRAGWHGDDNRDGHGDRHQDHGGRPGWLMPAIVIGIAVIATIGLGRTIGSIGHFHAPIPLIIIGVCVFFFLKSRNGRGCGRGRGRDRGGWGGPGGRWGAAQGPGWYGGPGNRADDAAGGTSPGTSTTGPATSAPSASSASTGVPRNPDSSVHWDDDDPLGLYADDRPGAAMTATEARPTQVRRNPIVKPAVLVLTAGAMAVAFMIGASLAWTCAIGLMVLGAGMALGSLAGRTAGLFPIGVILGVVTIGATYFGGIPDVSSRTVTPGSISQSGQSFSFGLGDNVLDLSKVDIAPGATVNVNGTGGRLRVILPNNDWDVAGSASVGGGQVDAFGRQQGGRDVSIPLDDLGTDASDGPHAINLDAHLRGGQLELERAS